MSEVDSDNIGRKIVSGGIWRLVAFGLATGLGVVATAIISREVGPANFALFTTAISLLTIATSLSDWGLLALGMREFAALKGEERIRNQRALITLRFGLAIVASTGIVLFAIAKNYPSELITGLIAATLGLCALSLHQSFNVPLHIEYRLNTIAVLEASRQLLLTGGMIILALATGEIGWIVAIYLPVGIVMAVASALLTMRGTSIIPSFDGSAMLHLIKHVGTFAVAGSIGAIYAYVAQVLSNSILTPHDAGMFALAFRVFAVMLGGCMTAVSGAFPLLVTSSREDPDRLAFATRRLVQTTALAGTLCAVGLVTGAPFVVDVIGGPDYTDAVPLVAIIGLALPASFVLITGSNVLLAADRHRELIVVSVFGALASIALTGVLTEAFGMEGAAAGIVAGEVVIATGYVIQIARLDRRALPAPLWALGVLVVGAIACAPALLDMHGLVRAVFGGSIFVVLALALRLVPPELTDRLKPGQS